MSCSNGTHASRRFLSFLLRWRQPQPRNRSISKEEERQPRAPPLQLPRLTQRPPLTQRPHRARRPHHTSPHRVPRRRWPYRELRHTSPHRARRRWPHRELRHTSLHRELRHTSPHREPRRTSPHRVPRRGWPLRALRRTSPHRVMRLRKLAGRARCKHPALRRSSLPVRPAAHPPRPWRAMRRRREPLRFRRSNSRKSPAAMPADKLDRRWPNPADAAISRAKPRQRALRQRQALGQQRRALPQQHSPLASDAMGPRNKAWLRSRAQFRRRAASLHRPALGRLATRAPSPAASCAIMLLPTWPVPAIPVRAGSRT